MDAPTPREPFEAPLVSDPKGRSLLEVVRAYEARWFEALPLGLLVARLLEAARSGRWARVDSFGAKGRIPLDELIPLLVLQLDLDPKTRAVGDEVLERLFDLHAWREEPTPGARALARRPDMPLEARAFGAALLARRGDPDVPLRWIELLRDPRFESARLDGFLGRRLDALAERLWRLGEGAAVARLVRDAGLADRALRRLCAPIVQSAEPALELVIAIVDRWFHDQLGNDPLVSAALAHAGACTAEIGRELLLQAVRLEHHCESAMRALIERRDMASVDAIGDCLFAPPSGDPLRAARIRRTAAAGLVRLATRDAAELLLTGARAVDRPDLREACRHALVLLRSELAGKARLRAALERCEPELRERALELLRSGDFSEYLPALIERLGA